MSYLVDEQNTVYKTLSNSIKKDRISHAYLFEGEPGTPKLDMAMLFAKALMCENSNSLKPCDECSNCREFDNNISIDFHIIKPDGTSIKKEQIEEVQKKFDMKSYGKKKIYIIDGAENMTIGASNSLLKFLEEPHEGTHAILITNNIYKVTKTIVSRCQIVPFKPLSLNEEVNDYIKEGYNETISKLAIILSSSKSEIKMLLEEEFLDSALQNVIKLINIFENSGLNVLLEIGDLWNGIFKNKAEHLIGLEIMFLFYQDVINYYYKDKIEVYDKYISDIKIIMDKNEIESIIYKVETILKAKQSAERNANMQLLLEQLFITMKGVKDHV